MTVLFYGADLGSLRCESPISTLTGGVVLAAPVAVGELADARGVVWQWVVPGVAGVVGAHPLVGGHSNSRST